MPTSGFETYNTAGDLVLNTESQAFHLRTTGSTTTSWPGIGIPQYLGSLSVDMSAYSVPVIAARKTGSVPVWIAGSFLTGSDRTYIPATTTGGNIDWYLFDLFNASASDVNFGLELYDHTGARIYNSGLTPPMRVVGFGTNITGLDSGRTYAVVLTSKESGTFVDPVLGTLITWEAFKMSSTAVWVERLYVQITPGFPPVYTYVTPTISDTDPLKSKALVIDVTNLSPS